MEEKLRFVFEHELQERTMTELCDRYDARSKVSGMPPATQKGPFLECGGLAAAFTP